MSDTISIRQELFYLCLLEGRVEYEALNLAAGVTLEERVVEDRGGGAEDELVARDHRPIVLDVDISPLPVTVTIFDDGQKRPPHL